MLVLNKKAKIILAVIIFILIAGAGSLVEHFERDAFIMEEMATDDNALYKPVGESEKDGLININAASEDDLKTLEGIGESLAARIVEYRSKNGPFVTKEEIMKISGIGAKKFENIKDDICAE